MKSVVTGDTWVGMAGRPVGTAAGWPGTMARRSSLSSVSFEGRMVAMER